MSSLNPSALPFVPADADFELVSIPIEAPDKKALEYPFSFISVTDDEDKWGTDYKIKDFSKGLLGEEKCDPGKFPDNIIEFYWIYEGTNDEEPWRCLCKLDNNNYAYYTALCDYTGFDCQGGMTLIVSKDLKRLFYEGLTESERKKCLKDKEDTF